MKWLTLFTAAVGIFLGAVTRADADLFFGSSGGAGSGSSPSGDDPPFSFTYSDAGNSVAAA